MGAKAGSKGSKGSKGFSSKGAAAAPVQKPWLKATPAPIGRFSAKGSGKQSSSSAGSYRAPIAAWSSRVETKGTSKGKSFSTGISKGGSKGSFKGKGKDKGKGKGKFKSAAPKKSQFWVRKLEEENRTVLEGELLTGVCDSYNWKAGWGFIMPDDPDSVPQEAREKLDEHAEASKAKGKEIDANLIYFRKPDVEANFRIMKDSAVTFQIYIDDKGCGACEVCNAGGDEEEEEADE